MKIIILGQVKEMEHIDIIEDMKYEISSYGDWKPPNILEHDESKGYLYTDEYYEDLLIGYGSKAFRYARLYMNFKNLCKLVLKRNLHLNEDEYSIIITDLMTHIDGIKSGYIERLTNKYPKFTIDKSIFNDLVDNSEYLNNKKDTIKVLMKYINHTDFNFSNFYMVNEEKMTPLIKRYFKKYYNNRTLTDENKVTKN